MTKHSDTYEALKEETERLTKQCELLTTLVDQLGYIEERTGSYNKPMQDTCTRATFTTNRIAALNDTIRKRWTHLISTSR